MYIIKENKENTLIIKNSKFITYLYNIDNLEEITIILKKLENKHKEATHHTYAYILNNKEKAFDDKEPKGTAGLPILNVLKKKELTNTLCVVIRYFGGTKLGAGGLIRAYSKSAKEAINNTILIKYIKTKEKNITFNYQDEKKILNIIKNFNIVDKKYKQTITYKIEIPTKIYEETIKKLDKYLI